MKQSKKIDEALLKKALSGKATQEERQQLLETAEIAYLMKRQWDQSSNETVKTEIGKKVWTQVANNCWNKDKKRLWVSRAVWALYAACITVILLISSIWLPWERSGGLTEEYQNVFADTHKQLTLPDHSKVWMQPGSSVRFSKEFDKNRKVWLKGDATFEVTKQTEHPFKVYINKAFIEVKGTAFRVAEKKDNRNEITLFNGQIDFHTPINGKTVRMTPNQRITYLSDGKTVLENISHISWQNGLYKFNGMRLDSLISTVNRFCNTNIKLSPSIPNHHLFTGTIRYNELPSEIAGKICYNMNLKYKREVNSIIIYK